MRSKADPSRHPIGLVESVDRVGIMQKPHQNRASSRRGSVALPAVIAAVLLVAIVGLTLDVSTVLKATSELQRAADECALVAARRLEDHPSRVRAAAAHVASTHLAAGAPVHIEPQPDDEGDGDVLLGTWDLVTRSFTAGVAEPNAVRVTVRRGAGAKLYFDYFFGRGLADLAKTAVAVSVPAKDASRGAATYLVR
jgi:uncharacterized membrane protein